MTRFASLLVLASLIGTSGSIAHAQLQVVVDECSTTTPSVEFGADGTAAIQDTIDVISSVDIADTRALVQITHAFVGDLTISLSAPDFTTVGLHAAAGGSNDNLDVTFTDSGIFNGVPFDCACDMQPGGPGVMADFNGATSQGGWVLDVSDGFPTSGGGTLDNWCLEILSDMPEPFIRGDVDGDGNFNGLVDGVAALSYQFVPGSSAPPCMKAADADDNGSFNGIIDAAICLNFQFVPSSPAPAPPHPSCGMDPTADGLDCAVPLVCP